jgi:hypothetical protein
LKSGLWQAWLTIDIDNDRRWHQGRIRRLGRNAGSRLIARPFARGSRLNRRDPCAAIA